MGRRRAYGYTLVSWEADHPPLYVHIYDRRDQEVGRWDVEGQRGWMIRHDQEPEEGAPEVRLP